MLLDHVPIIGYLSNLLSLSDVDLSPSSPTKGTRGRGTEKGRDMPYIVNDLLISMRQRDNALSKARRTGRPADWITARTLRSRLCMDIKTAKANVMKGKLERYNNNPKRFWQEINKLLPH